jgi:hypothetical protein
VPDSPPQLRHVPKNLIGEIPSCLYQASAKGRQETCQRWAEAEGAILIGYSGQRSFPESSPLREAHRRSCRCLLPKNQYSAQTCLPSAQDRASSEGAAIVDPLPIGNANRAMGRITMPSGLSAYLLLIPLRGQEPCQKHVMIGHLGPSHIEDATRDSLGHNDAVEDVPRTRLGSVCPEGSRERVMAPADLNGIGRCSSAATSPAPG